LSSLWIVLAVRCLLVLLFLPFSALDKILNLQQAITQAEQAITARSLATALIFVGFGIELLMSLAIVTGIADRLAAFILAGYCVLTALLWKQFWKAPDFRLKGQSRGREVFWDFLKNLGLSGGFLVLALGTDASGVQRFWNHPFSSSHPYAAIAPAGGTP
jgi:putative oxidoreductase